MALLLVPGAGVSNSFAASQPSWGNIDLLRTGQEVAGPPGWLSYCFADPAICRPASGAATVPATAETLALALRIHREVNDRIRAQAEPPGQDHWRLAPEAGDCEDFALTKQAMLRAAGLPSASVRLAVAQLPRGERHAVVTIATTRGTLVLDNLQTSVVPLRQLEGYRWLKLEQPGPQMRWQELQGPPDIDALQLTSEPNVDGAATARTPTPIGRIAQ